MLTYYIIIIVNVYFIKIKYLLKLVILVNDII